MDRARSIVCPTGHTKATATLQFFSQLRIACLLNAG